MKNQVKVCLGLLLPSLCSAHSSSQDPFQYDYCSYVHSQHVLDRVNSEVKPIFEKYGVAMVPQGDLCMLSNFAPYAEQLKRFSSRGQYRTNFQCEICDKKFESEDHLELHFKQSHFRSQKLQTEYQDTGVVCPAELCDVFECPELPQKALRLQVFMERTDGNYEGAPDYRQGLGGVKKKEANELPPFRWEMMEHYDVGRRPHLLQRCHRVFLDCVDHSRSASVDQTMKAFDVYSQIYCQKFNGQIESKEAEAQEQLQGLGVYKMLHDMHDQAYMTPLPGLEAFRPLEKPGRESELHSVLWWVGLTIACILTFLYAIGMYFTYFDDPKEFERQVSNRGWKTQASVNSQRQLMHEAKRRDAQMSQQFAAPTETQAYRDLQAQRGARRQGRGAVGKDD